MSEKELITLQEGPRWVVINKPAGIATEKNFDNDTVEARAQEQWKRPGSKKSPYVGIVHRLDRPVSGALLLARNKSTLVSLNQAFADKKTEKTYWALTENPLPKESGTLKDYLTRDKFGRKAVASKRLVSGAKEAVLDYRLLAEYDGLYHYEIMPITGRFHQIRIQLATAGAPVVGDATYGSLRIVAPYVIQLHARRLAFPTPEGEIVSVDADVPDTWIHPTTTLPVNQS